MAAAAVPQGEPLVVVDNVSFRYFESPSSGITDVSLTFRPGERVLLLGKNGQGKSTLLSLIGGKRAAAKGKVSVLGLDAFDCTSLNHKVTLIGTPWPPEAYFNCTVERVASQAPDEERRARIARELHLPLKANIDKMSAGEKRRVQILHGMLRVPTVMLLDECSTEVDVAERRNVLRLAQAETDQGACCIYATHILDGVEDWATRVIVMENGRVIRDESYADGLGKDKLQAHQWLARKPFTAFPPVTDYSLPQGDALTDDATCVKVDKLTFRHVFDGCSLRIPTGARALLVGCNGSGKSTLLHLLAGKTFFANKNSEVTVLGRKCYHDMSLNALSSFGGDWWTRVPGGQMEVGELISTPPTRFAQTIIDTLEINLRWDVRYVSAGEQKRIQLLIALNEPSQVILLDEATADLDLDMRHVLLRLLYTLNVEHGVTVVYTTHIFEGLSNWATDCVILDRTKKGVHEHLRGPEVDLERVKRTMCELKDKEHFEL